MFAEKIPHTTLLHTCISKIGKDKFDDSYYFIPVYYARGATACEHQNAALHSLGLLALLALLLFSRNEPLPDSLYHLAKPVYIQKAQRGVSHKVDSDEPHGQFGDFAADRSAIRPATRVTSTHIVDREQSRQLGSWCRQGLVDVGVDHDRLVGAPNYSTGEECEEERDTIVQLEL